jgi:peptidoglycan/LPS O-acetylase OafA/YrhL
MFGVLGAYMAFYHKTIWLKHKKYLLAAGLLFIFAPTLNQWTLGNAVFDRYLALTVSSLGTLLLIPQLSSIASGKGFLFSSLTRISKISYSMYLIHASFLMIIVFPFVIKTINGFTGNNYLRALAEYGLYWAAAIVISQILYTYYEYPLMKLRDKIKAR